MKKDNSNNLALLVQSLDEELQKLKKQIGYHKEKKAVSVFSRYVKFPSYYENMTKDNWFFGQSVIRKYWNDDV